MVLFCVDTKYWSAMRLLSGIGRNSVGGVCPQSRRWAVPRASVSSAEIAEKKQKVIGGTFSLVYYCCNMRLFVRF